MAQEFTMPKLGLTMTDGTIREWLVPDGASVQVGDPVLVIETDKVETEVEAREAGVLSISGVVGENYECGDVIGHLLADGEQPSTSPAPAGSPPAAPPQEAPGATAQPVSSPPEPVVVGAAAAHSSGRAEIAVRGEGGRILASPRARAAARSLSVDLVEVAGTGPGGRIVADDVTLWAESRPSVVSSAPSAPAAVSSAAVAGAAIASSTGSAAPPSSAPVARPVAQGASATAGARMLAELLGIDLRALPAPTPSGRLTREDVAAWVRSQLAGPAPVSSAASAAPPLQTPSSVVPLRGMRGVIAERMHASLTEMAQLTLSVDADMTAVNGERDRLKQSEQTVPGYTAWVIAAAARALIDHPYVNSQVTAEGVATLPEVHVGVAVALDEGLIVPVITNAALRPVDELHTVVADLAGRARDAKLKLHELEGGTFSVTALGMYGVDMFTPVINPPNSAILGVGRLRTDTRWENGVPSPTTVMTLSLTWDHRAFDGAPAAEFAQSIVRYLENPAQLSG